MLMPGEHLGGPCWHMLNGGVKVTLKIQKIDQSINTR
jgi:hypothetical protein